jgi:hypothetical protein
MVNLIALLPLILQLLGWALKWYGASEETLTHYKALVESSAKSNLISVNVKDRLLAQRERIRERIKAKENPPE